MLDLKKYTSIGGALRDALETWPTEVCLIESDRGEEKLRLTYHEFKERALPLAKALQDFGIGAGDRVSIIMTNQSKWLISAYAIFFCGATLVPLDYKLKPEEQWQLLKHSGAKILITEYGIWRQLGVSPRRAQAVELKNVLATEAPENADLAGAVRWEEVRGAQSPVFVERALQDIACIVYSSGTGGTPKGCMMTHGNYLEQCMALTSLYPFWPGVRYLSILPTNHAIDFMVGFFGPFTCGAAVVHLRTLRPEYVREAFPKYEITYVSLVPLVLKNLQKGLQARFDELPASKRKAFEAVRNINRALTKDHPRLWLSRKLLGEVHSRLGGKLEAIIVGGAFTEPQTLQFFYDLGVPVANGYGLTEAGTAVTVNDLKPFRADTVGKPLPGMEVEIRNADAEGIGEVTVRSKTVMAGYLNEPELTSETIVDGWLHTGDMGRFDSSGHLQLFGRKKNMIVTEEGKNVYAEDVEQAFEGLRVKEFCVFAANYVWPQRSMVNEKLILVIHLEPGQAFTEELKAEISTRNSRLLNYKRVHGLVVYHEDFPLTASMKIKRNELAGRLATLDREQSIVPLLPGNMQNAFSGKIVSEKILAIVNPAAGGGRSAKLAGAELARLKEKGLRVDAIASMAPGHAAQLAREAYEQGYRRFLAVGGDGTAHEVINGIFTREGQVDRIALGFLPMGRGNSFLRDYTDKGADASMEALLAGRTRRVDLLRLRHATGTIYSFNLLSVGFTADVAALTNRVFKPFGHLGYLLGVFVRVVQLKRRAFKLCCDDDASWDERRCLFLTFNNSKYTGGTMLIAPNADPSSGFIEFVRWGPIGRLGLLKMLPRLYDGTHTTHPLSETRRVKHVEFELGAPVDVMVDGEVVTVSATALDVLPGAMDVYV